MPNLKQLVPFTIITICFLISIWCFTVSRLVPASGENVRFANADAPLVVIDAGHGGDDPGKVGVAGTHEKEINLIIAKQLQALLESQDVQVIMTRSEDIHLGNGESGWKLADMKARIAIINEAQPDVVISIHQNSYTTPDILGAQCFYYTNSEDSARLAALLQKQIVQSTNQTKVREIKANSDYYLLKKSQPPTVIVECGFLSNPQEEQLLLSPAYQRKMAWAIHLGILQYLEGATPSGT